MVRWRGDRLTQIHKKLHPLQDLILSFLCWFDTIFHAVLLLNIVIYFIGKPKTYTEDDIDKIYIIVS